ncbi:hypothetical protein E4S40_00960 [Algoriphagus kandeliae]|uniref:Class I SAM-dependent methyltransferase n=1 Tax=Algoriphagus kandeliae TaxID=2562278 RepID=A0A4Y9QYS7_9BACT|nr:hypothetical protein [Algoriphagus kandeliae]TFV97257.1 hypothetical protein E4S40_00960 [Algoriphagus kandeliae]
MRSFLAKIRDKLFGIDKIAFLIKNESEKQIQKADFKYRELKAIEILKPYLPDGFLFETSYSISFQTIQHIINDIVIYKPKIILEFGSGLSTLIIGNFIKKQKLETKLISLDDDNSWQNLLKSQSKEVDFYCIPLIENNPLSFQGKGIWFGIPSDHPVTKEKYDMVIVDAPKGSSSKFSRFGFIPFVKDRLSKDAIIYLDDTDRFDEKVISDFIISELGNRMTIQKYYRYSRFSSNQDYYTSPS